MICQKVPFQSTQSLPRGRVHHLQITLGRRLADVPQELGDLGEGDLLLVVQQRGDIMSDTMEAKGPDARLLAQGLHDLWATHEPGACLLVEEDPVILAALLPERNLSEAKAQYLTAVCQSPVASSEPTKGPTGG